ncbi:hypothetical protein [Corallococcus sp. EGB]|uniref:hypothetical protein n=1 Tax=Corallococcus sp. EGB TaxID=1521117 RepID=UPI001CBF880E|nr:hypothetical protein [Corallococcus sp. EGB]
MVTRSVSNRAFSLLLYILTTSIVAAGCSPWRFRLRERPDVAGDKPHSLLLRCGDQPIRFAVTDEGFVRGFGPVKLTCDPMNPSNSCTAPNEQGEDAHAIKVEAGAWLMVEAHVDSLPKGASTANGALCWGEKAGSSECAVDAYLLDLYIECQNPIVEEQKKGAESKP